MAFWYLYDGGNNTGAAGTDDPSLASNWTNAMDDIVAVEALIADGDTVYTASDHIELSAVTIDVVFSHAINAKVKYITVNRSTGVYETMITGGGSIEVTGGSNDISLNGNAYLIGFDFVTPDFFEMNNSASNAHIILEDSRLTFVDDFTVTGDGTHTSCVTIINVEVITTTSGSGFVCGRQDFTMIGGSFSASSAMTGGGFINASQEGVNATFRSVDMSGIFANTPVMSNVADRSNILFERCKMWSGWTIPDPTIPPTHIKMHSCDTGDGYNFFTEVDIKGRTIQDTSVHITPDFSAKMVSTAGTIEWAEPLRFKLCEVYSTANPTLTVEYIHEAQGSGTGGDLQNDEFWIEVEYPDVTDEAFGKFDVSNKAATIRTTPTDQDNSTATWTEGLTGEIKQKSAVTISGGAAGIHTIWSCLAKPSTTVYVDPDVTVS